MKCKQIQRYLSEKLDDELSPTLCRIVEKHLEICPLCCEVWNKLVAQENLLSHLSWEDPGEVYWDRYLEKVKFEHKRKRTQLYTLGFVASLIFIVTIGTTLLVQNKKQNIPPSKRFAKGKKYEYGMKWQQRFLDQALRGNVIAMKKIQTFYKKHPHKIPYLKMVSYQDELFLKNVLKLFSFVRGRNAFEASKNIYHRGKLRDQALKTMIQINPQRSLKILISQLETGDRKTFKALKLIGRPSSLFIIHKIETLQEKSPNVFLEALAFINDETAFSYLLFLAQKGKLRRRALVYLGASKRKKAVFFLLKAMSNRALKKDVIQGLRRMKRIASEVILTMLRYVSDNRARKLLMVLGELQVKGLSRKLISFFHRHERKCIKKEVINILIKLKDPISETFLITLASRRIFRKKVFQGLGNFQTQRVRKFLLRNLYKKDVQLYVLKSLGKFHNPKDIPHIIALLEISSHKKVIMSVLSKMPKNYIIPYFINMLHHPSLKRISYKMLKKITRKKFRMEQYRWRAWYKTL